MSHRVSLRVQLTAMLTVVSFLLATMSPVGALAKPVPAAKASPAAKPADRDDDKGRGTHSLSSFVQVPATNTNTGAATTFTGLLNITSFTSVNGALNAVGTLRGSGADGTIQSASVMIPVSAIDPSCQVLTLTLAPLDLNLLGLVVHLDQVHLTIVAVSGGGNLLGNLICAVANLLNPGGSLSNLVANLVTALNALLAGL